MSKLVTLAEYRMWMGPALPSTTPDSIIQDALDSAEAGLVADVGCQAIDAIITNLDANVIAREDIMLRTSNKLAKRNSPEGVAGVGEEGFITIPATPNGSQVNVRQIKKHLRISVVVIA